ncbi:hypothetical protein EGT07_03085 [Herbaspirillum sp. HC18]|nr:hypothetical protein EGT07_03085 [Herbaspirillum sp. HC18]
MKPGHFFAALFLAFGIGQHAFAEEPKTPDAPQEVQQPSVARDAAQLPEKALQADSSMPAAAATSATAKSEGEAAHSREAQTRSDTFLHEIKATDILLAVFTGLLVLLGWVQARRMRDAVSAAKDSAAIAEKSARVAEDALIAGQRAFMFIREIKTILHQDPETGKYHWTIHPVWANSGNTPTRGLSINTTYRLLDEPLPKDYNFPESQEDLIPTIAGPRSMVEATPGAISSEDLEAVQGGKKFFYIWGWAEYNDIFEGTRKRVTRFCNQLIQVDGDPAAPASEHNPIQMMFGFHSENNYAD